MIDLWNGFCLTVFLVAIVSIPLLVALFRGERVRYRSQVRAFEIATSDIQWIGRDGAHYAMIRDQHRVRVRAMSL